MKVKQLLTALAVPLLLLVSCTNDGPDPILAPTPSSTPTPTSATPSPSETSEPETAEEFVRRWVELSNAMQVTGDTEAYLEVSKECRPCRTVSADMARIYEDGGFVQTKGWEIRAFVHSSQLADERVVDARIYSYAVRLKRTNDAAFERLPAGLIGIRFRLAVQGGSWILRTISEVPL